MTRLKRALGLSLPIAAIVLGLIGIVLIVKTVPDNTAESADVTPAATPANQDVVAGAGLVEPASELIGVATPVSAVVVEVNVRAGQRVRKGDALFVMENRTAQAEYDSQRAALAAVQSELSEARIEAARTANELKLYQSIGDARAMSREELAKRTFAAQTARAVTQTRQAKLEQAQANVTVAKVQIALLTVRAPIDGDILQVSVRPGQFATANILADPLVIMGSAAPLNIRVDVDEADIGRLKIQGVAQVFTRGVSKSSAQASFVRVEPLVIPKQSLTNAADERVDTRVLQVIYTLPANAKGFFVGQQVDVFLPATGSGS